MPTSMWGHWPMLELLIWLAVIGFIIYLLYLWLRPPPLNYHPLPPSLHRRRAPLRPVKPWPMPESKKVTQETPAKRKRDEDVWPGPVFVPLPNVAAAPLPEPDRPLYQGHGGSFGGGGAQAAWEPITHNYEVSDGDSDSGGGDGGGGDD
jgi:hypothetical protein